MNSKLNSFDLVTPPPYVELQEKACRADQLLQNSGHLLKLVLQQARIVIGAADRLMNTFSEIEDNDVKPAGNDVSKNLDNRRAVIDSANRVIQMASLASVDIRNIIGWHEHPFRSEKRNGSNSLIGIELAIAELFDSVVFFSDPDDTLGLATKAVRQAILAMMRAAEKNTASASDTAVATEAIATKVALAIRAC